MTATGLVSASEGDAVRFCALVGAGGGAGAVSYTHLDVYKRQLFLSPTSFFFQNSVSFSFLHTQQKRSTFLDPFEYLYPPFYPLYKLPIPHSQRLNSISIHFLIVHVSAP